MGGYFYLRKDVCVEDDAFLFRFSIVFFCCPLSASRERFFSLGRCFAYVGSFMSIPIRASLEEAVLLFCTIALA